MPAVNTLFLVFIFTHFPIRLEAMRKRHLFLSISSFVLIILRRASSALYLPKYSRSTLSVHFLLCSELLFFSFIIFTSLKTMMKASHLEYSILRHNEAFPTVAYFLFLLCHKIKTLSKAPGYCVSPWLAERSFVVLCRRIKYRNFRKHNYNCLAGYGKLNNMNQCTVCAIFAAFSAI